MEFFAGINTEQGYKSYLAEYLADCRRVYIIKGTCGSGKSTLMKAVAEAREKEGEQVVRIRCSSDTGSLDGVILPQKGIAICDGTPPHPIEPKYPVAREVLVDLGRFCQKSKLNGQRILELADKKALCYKKAYLYIGAAVAAERVASMCTETDRDKMQGYCCRFYKSKLASGVKGKADMGVVSAFTAAGVETCGKASAVYTLKHGREFLEMLKEIALRDGERVTLCPHHTDSKRLYGIYFHGSDALVTEGKEESEKTLNLSRYLTKIGEYKAALSVRDSAYEAARKELENARGLHSALESEYSRGMDFEGLCEIRRQLMDETV